MNRKDLKGIRVFKSSLVDTFQIWGKVTRRSEEEALYGAFGPYQDKERNPVFNRPGLYHDRVSKTAWFEIETRPGVIRAFSTDWEFQEWEWNTRIKHGEQVLSLAEFKEMKRMFKLYNVPKEQRPSVYLASQEYWSDKDLRRDFALTSLRYEKKHGSIKERIELRRKARGAE